MLTRLPVSTGCLRDSQELPTKVAVLTSWALFIASVSEGLAAEPRAFVCKFPEGTFARYEGALAAFGCRFDSHPTKVIKHRKSKR
jgi:hypothetical protein